MSNRSSRFSSLVVDAVSFLEEPFSSEETKEVVWDCGGDRAPGPNGFSFKFLRHFWDVLGSDVIGFVQEFYFKPIIPMGCNSSFITLILKVDNPLLVKDFWPFSLIGMQFKVIAKLFAKRLAYVLLGVIGVEQSAFLKGRRILDGQLMVSELISWYKKIKKFLNFKVGFEKTYDSVNWDYQDQIMQFMGFGIRWSLWIIWLFKNSKSSVLLNGSPTDEF